MRTLRSLVAASITALVALGLSAVPVAAEELDPPTPEQAGQSSVPNPNGVAVDPYTGYFYVTKVGQPPQLLIYEEVGFGVTYRIDLPTDSEPGAVAFDPVSGFVYVIDHAQDRVFVINPNTHEVTTLLHPAAVAFATGTVPLNNAPAQPVALLDFGDGFSAGSIWYGTGFGQRLTMPDTITPNGGDLLVTGKPVRGQVPDEILFTDANHNQLGRVSDSPTPSFLGTIPGLPGTPGLQPVRGMDIGPLNLNSNVSGTPVYPIYVAFPDIGLFQSAGPNGPWIQIPAGGIGKPSQIASDCDSLAATSFSQNLVTFFRQRPPKGSHCEGLVELRVKHAAPGIFGGALQAFVDGTATVRAIGAGPGQHPVAYEAKKAKKLKLTAGRLTKFKFSLPGAIQAQLRARHKVRVKVKIRVTSPLGQKAKVVRRVRIRGG